jgi:hypothetical protein
MPDARQLSIPIFFGQSQRSWPKYGDLAKRVQYLPLAVGLTRRFRFDAHFAAYTTPRFPRRLSAGALSMEGKARLPEGAPMILALFDVDCDASHKASGREGGAPASDLWW